MAGLKPHVPAIYRVAATGLGASMWFFVCAYLPPFDFCSVSNWIVL